jgi:hypothetical protein
MRRILLIVAVAAGLLCGLQRAQATSLSPGDSTTSFGTTGPSGSNLAVVADTGAMSYTLTNAGGHTTGTGTFEEYVLKGDTNNSYGGLDFVYQITVKTGSLSSLSLTDFSAASKIDLAQVAGPITLGDGKTTILSKGSKTAASADWTSDSTTLDFSYTNASAGTTTYVMVIRTDRTQSTAGYVALVGGGGVSTKMGFAPAPEPASMVLLGCCFAGLGGTGLWRRLRRRRAG